MVFLVGITSWLFATMDNRGTKMACPICGSRQRVKPFTIGNHNVCPMCGNRRTEMRSIVADLHPRFKKGIYETTYGNAAYVSGPSAKSAYDLDMAERIPLSWVTPKFLGGTHRQPQLPLP